MKSSHGDQAEGGLMHSRPTVDARDVIYGLTSLDCTSAHPRVTKGDQGGLPDKGDQEEGGLMLSRPTVDMRDFVYGITISDCTSAHPRVMKGDRGGLPDRGDQEEGGLMLSGPTMDVRDVIYGLTSSDCTSVHPGVTKGSQGGLPGSGEKVEVVESIPKVDKLLLTAGLKINIEINDYSYFFKSWTMTGIRTRILHHVMHSKYSGKILKNTVKRKFLKEKKLNCIPKFESKTVETMDQTQKTYFAGVHDTSNIRCILETNNAAGYRINYVHSLEIFDSQVGGMMEGVFSLATR
jgi:hypothetical protein